MLNHRPCIDKQKSSVQSLKSSYNNECISYDKTECPAEKPKRLHNSLF